MEAILSPVILILLGLILVYCIYMYPMILVFPQILFFDRFESFKSNILLLTECKDRSKDASCLEYTINAIKFIPQNYQAKDLLVWLILIMSTAIFVFYLASQKPFKNLFNTLIWLALIPLILMSLSLFIFHANIDNISQYSWYKFWHENAIHHEHKAIYRENDSIYYDNYDNNVAYFDSSALVFDMISSPLYPEFIINSRPEIIDKIKETSSFYYTSIERYFEDINRTLHQLQVYFDEELEPLYEKNSANYQVYISDIKDAIPDDTFDKDIICQEDTNVCNSLERAAILKPTLIWLDSQIKKTKKYIEILEQYQFKLERELELQNLTSPMVHAKLDRLFEYRLLEAKTQQVIGEAKEITSAKFDPPVQEKITGVKELILDQVSSA